jgi:hypothetical protein
METVDGGGEEQDNLSNFSTMHYFKLMFTWIKGIQYLCQVIVAERVFVLER